MQGIASIQEAVPTQMMYLQALEKIVTHLEATALREGDGVFWESIEMTGYDQWRRESRLSLYSGNAGIALFLHELTRHVPSERYSTLSEKSFKWLLTNIEPGSSGFCGSISSVFPLISLYQQRRDPEIKQKILRIMDHFRDLKPGNLHEIINGNAGTLIHLLKWHETFQTEWVFEKIQEFTRHLMKSLKWGEVGCFWDQSDHQIKPLCGFSHGVSGIGYVFLELGRYLNCPDLLQVADLAFQYERQWLHKYSFWPDLRKAAYKPETETNFLNSLRKGEIGPFTTPGRMEAWCHGAPGIGLARLRAHRLTPNQTYFSDLKAALEISKKAEKQAMNAPFADQNLTLCHGRCGNIDFLLEAGTYLEDEESLQLVGKFKQQLIQHLGGDNLIKSGYPIGDHEDPSLFMGTAGIGYFLLRCMSKLRIPNIMAPEVHGASPSNVHIEFPSISMLESNFPMTLDALKQEEVDYHDIINDNESSISSILERLKLHVSNVGHELPGVADAYAVESQKWQLETQNASHALAYYRTIACEQDFRQKKEGLSGSQVLFTHPTLRLHTSNQETYVAILLKAYHANVIPLERFQFELLSTFQNGCRIEDAINQLAQLCSTVSMSEQNQLHGLIFSQIEQAIQGHFLVFHRY